MSHISTPANRAQENYPQVAPLKQVKGVSTLIAAPQLRGGDIFDLDTPGIENGSQANSVYRYRVNFQEYATLPDGTTVVSTAPVNYYVRVSCTFDSSGNPSLDTTASGDNQIGLGTTATSWNLQ